MIKTRIFIFFTALFFILCGNAYGHSFVATVVFLILGSVSVSLVSVFSMEAAEKHINIYISERKEGEEQ